MSCGCETNGPGSNKFCCVRPLRCVGAKATREDGNENAVGTLQPPRRNCIGRCLRVTCILIDPQTVPLYYLSMLKSWGVMFWANWNCFDLGGATGEDRAEDSVGYDSGKWYSVWPRLVPKKPV